MFKKILIKEMGSKKNFRSSFVTFLVFVAIMFVWCLSIFSGTGCGVNCGAFWKMFFNVCLILFLGVSFGFAWAIYYVSSEVGKITDEIYLEDEEEGE